MDKNAAISAAIWNKMESFARAENGRSVTGREALKAGIDHVLGEGTFDRLVSEVYDELRARA